MKNTRSIYGCYCVSSEESIMREKTKPQTVTVITLGFIAAQWEMSKSNQSVHGFWIRTVSLLSASEAKLCFRFRSVFIYMPVGGKASLD